MYLFNNINKNFLAIKKIGKKRIKIYFIILN